MRTCLAVVALLFGTAISPSAAQTPGELIDAGARAYRGLDFDSAAILLRRVLSLDPQELPRDARIRGLTYLGAAEVYRENPDSARATFARLVRAEPRFAIDRLVFPPEVTDVFDAVRLAVKVVEVVVPDSVGFVPGVPAFTVALYASSFHEVTAAIVYPDGSPVRTVFSGPIADSLAFAWDGLSSGTSPVRSGSYELRVSSRDTDGTLVRVVRVGLGVELVAGDTLPHPPPLLPSALLPERRPARRGLEALGGAAIGIAVIGLSTAIAPGVDLSTSRFLIGATAAAAGTVGFMRNRPGAALTDNVQANERVRERWRAEVRLVSEENARRRAATRLTVRRGPVQVLEPER